MKNSATKKSAFSNTTLPANEMPPEFVTPENPPEFITTQDEVVLESRTTLNESDTFLSLKYPNHDTDVMFKSAILSNPDADYLNGHGKSTFILHKHLHNSGILR